MQVDTEKWDTVYQAISSRYIDGSDCGQVSFDACAVVPYVGTQPTAAVTYVARGLSVQ